LDETSTSEVDSSPTGERAERRLASVYGISGDANVSLRRRAVKVSATPWHGDGSLSQTT
jgi:hypothetical protein